MGAGDSLAKAVGTNRLRAFHPKPPDGPSGRPRANPVLSFERWSPLPNAKCPTRGFRMAMMTPRPSEPPPFEMALRWHSRSGCWDRVAPDAPGPPTHAVGNARVSHPASIVRSSVMFNPPVYACRGNWITKLIPAMLSIGSM